MTRVLHVTDYASSYPGAFIRQLRMLDDELRSRGAQPTAFALSAAALSQDWACELANSGCLLHEIPPGSTRAQGSVAAAIEHAIRTSRADIVHVHFGTYDLSARRAVLSVRAEDSTRRATSPKLIWHYRTALETAVNKRSLVRRGKDWIKYARAGRQVDMAVGVTEALAREIAQRGFSQDSRGVVAGCDTETFAPDQYERERMRVQLGLAADDIMLFHMGWHWHRKGGDLLAAAADLLHERGYDNLRFMSVGAPEDAELGRVERLPMTPDVHHLHQASDIFVSASRSEGFGNGLVEAMACERVAIAAMADGQIETFAGTPGVTAMPVDDAPALAEAIVAMIEHRDTWSTRGAANRQHVVEHHSMRRWARDMADAYGDLVPALDRSSQSLTTDTDWKASA